MDNLYAIILAAGNSSRFGSPKQLASWGNSNLLQHVIRRARSLVGERVIVVLGASADQIQQELPDDHVTIVINPDWQKGIATSIRTGVCALPASAAAAMILLCDQPLLEQTSLRRLAETWQLQPARIVASQYKDTIGVPAIFPASNFASLLTLSGDRGAKQILMQLKDQVLAITIPEAGIDIDTKQDFEHLLEQYQH